MNHFTTKIEIGNLSHKITKSLVLFLFILSVIKFYLVIGDVITKMFTKKVVLWSIVKLASIVTLSSCTSSPKTQEGMEVALDTTVSFFNMFIQCIDSPMPSMKFALDNPKSFVNYPSRTTVGFAPRFTSNRKFFANLLKSPEFKNMLEQDEKELRQNLINKMKYCDSVVMDEGLLQAMYNREVDQTKM